MPAGTTLTPHPTAEHTVPATAAPQPNVPAERLPVVVGVDSSSGSAAAVHWAAAEAQARGVALHIVHTWAWQMLEPWSHAVDAMVIADLKRESRSIVAEAVALAETHEGLVVTAKSVQGYAPDILAKLGKRSGLIVVGSHHLHAVGRAVLGSVSTTLVARASCPVVVLAAPAGLSGEKPGVVVGVTGTQDDERLLDFAFTYARRNGLSLRARFFWHPPFADATAPPPERAQAWLAESLAGWQEQFPEVMVSSLVARGHPVTGLVQVAASQDLLVVGRHSRRLRLGGLLGSVSLGVLHHATCPVAVVPPAERETSKRDR